MDSSLTIITNNSNKLPISRGSSSRLNLSESKALRRLETNRHKKVLERHQIKYSSGKIHSKGTSTIHRRRQESPSMLKIIFRLEFRKLFKTFCSRMIRLPTHPSNLNNSRYQLKLPMPQIQRSCQYRRTSFQNQQIRLRTTRMSRLREKSPALSWNLKIWRTSSKRQSKSATRVGWQQKGYT